MLDELKIKIKALTPIWTGGVDGRPDRLHETGIIGSLRWWYETIVRGLGGYACDPTGKGQCELTGKERTDEERRKKMCPVCYLFGCGGWGRKFKLEMRESNNGNVGNIITKTLKENKEIWIRFVPLRKIYPEEYILLLKTIELISKYGSIGGKTVFKPSENPQKNKKLHHQDFGLIELIKKPDLELSSRKNIEDFIKRFKSKGNDSDWPNLKYFWFVPEETLDRKVHNQIVNRFDYRPKDYSQNATELEKWLGGTQRESKKIISFHTASGKRTWGYARSAEELEQVIDMVSKAAGWKRNDFKKGEVVLNELF